MIQRPNRRPLPKAPAIKPLNLSQQQVDFTAEGSPPPGKVSGAKLPRGGTIKRAKPQSGV